MQDATAINPAMDATPVAQLAAQVAELLAADPTTDGLEPFAAELQSKLDALRQEWDSLQSEQQRLRETEARFMAFLRSSQDAVLLADPSGRIKTWNDGAERLFGLEGEQLDGRRWRNSWKSRRWKSKRIIRSPRSGCRAFIRMDHASRRMSAWHPARHPVVWCTRS